MLHLAAATCIARPESFSVQPTATATGHPRLGHMQAARYRGGAGTQPAVLPAGKATGDLQRQIKDGSLQHNLQSTAAVAAERGKEYSTRGWGYMKSAYASMAQQVEVLARDNGYNVDLGAF